ncbi:flagellin [Salinarchaeum sp. IM2453]|uniref:flagellin n=1 Tax=Salinarchaeum sp. IM2453 TaxID=2862870 RepID=UPI001C840217|nr:flagellin [Salinarchaeum sp. IM2453]QZA87457.1 flagellin [Salinarchaeum sp. IM2453]
MSGVSVSHAIMFIASMVVAAGVAGVLVAGVGQVGDSIADRSADTSEQIETDFEIISDPNAEEELYELNDDGDEVELLLKNIGSTELVADEQEISILVDGRLAENFDVEPTEGDEIIWETGSVAIITIDETIDDDLNLETGEDVSVHVTINGHEENIQFRVSE